MKLIDRSLFLARGAWIVVSASAVLILCQLLAGEAQAQTIWPLSVGRVIEQNAIVKATSSEADASRERENFTVALVNWRDRDFSLKAREPEFSLPEDPPGSKNESDKKAADSTDSGQQPGQDRRGRGRPIGFDWDRALRQSFYFLGIQHAFRLANEESTRAELGGPFFKDYFQALRSLRGWGDGDPFIVNYIGHPMMGSVTGFIQVQNDPKGSHEEVSLKKSYWKSRMKAMGWSFVYSTQFELGLISEASVGNIGIKPNGKSNHAMAYVDLVVTPVVGTGWLVGEDALDKYVIRRYEDRMPNRATLILFRSFLNPTRSFANVMRGKWPWFRDNRK